MLSGHARDVASSEFAEHSSNRLPAACDARQAALLFGPTLSRRSSMSLALYDTWSRTVRPFTRDPGRAGRHVLLPDGLRCPHRQPENLCVRGPPAPLERNGYAVRQVVNITDVGHLTSDADEAKTRAAVGPAAGGVGGATPTRSSGTGTHSTCSSRRCGAAPPITSPNRSRSSIRSTGPATSIGRTTASTSTPVGRTTTGISRGWTAPDSERASGALGGKRSITDFCVVEVQPGRRQAANGMGQPVGARLSGLAYRMLGDVGEVSRDVVRYPLRRRSYRAVHHNNEIAQTRAAHGTQLANYWMHGHFLTLDADARRCRSRGDDKSADLAAPRCRSARVPLSVPDGPLSKQAAFHVARRSTQHR